ncbi:MAG: pantoate--beta-alanine ligase [Bacteroidales bacterium]|nr:pantoate--beta-alanine ligase [Bacteroidales bacterium]MBN2698535.1 pantoate--beta-alanine ligase [Bacteroidales bacterium]
MEILETKKEITDRLHTVRLDGSDIGLVPTMGALHNGHASLISRAREENQTVVVSVFVNPTQFNDPQDLLKYPRTPERDIQLLGELQVDFVFIPGEKEMYPEPDERFFDLYPLDAVMEGKYRKNHFNGVAQIVTKLFDTIAPDRAYFGQKDFQQLVIVKRLVQLMGYNISIVACPIIREPDGLAMSSRNIRLSPEERQIAPFISQTLFKANKLKSNYSPSELKQWVIGQFRKRKAFKLEYFEIVDDTELKQVKEWSEHVITVGCIAVHLGKVRLIDNIIFN